MRSESKESPWDLEKKGYVMCHIERNNMECDSDRMKIYVMLGIAPVAIKEAGTAGAKFSSVEKDKRDTVVRLVGKGFARVLH
uniref:Uncharacterized protein n=1 Tax=Caenorhabditis japonica TaxID=281687 RepID=A0A8R1IFQ0_CAEJA